MCSLTLTMFLVSIPWIKLERLRKNRSAAVPWRDRRGRKREWDFSNTQAICVDAALVAHELVFYAMLMHTYTTISYSFQMKALSQLSDRLIHFICVRHELRLPGSQRKSTVSAPRVMHLEMHLGQSCIDADRVLCVPELVDPNLVLQAARDERI